MGGTGWVLIAEQKPSVDRFVPPSGSFFLGPSAAWKKETARGGQVGPLTFRQKFLLGRRLDLNQADTTEISDLPGISDAVAKAIVRERQRRGGFRRPEDLLAVPGIKEKRLKKILPFIDLFPNN